MNKHSPRKATEAGFTTIGHAAKAVVEDAAVKAVALERLSPEVAEKVTGLDQANLRAALEQARKEIAANQNKPTLYHPNPYRADGAAHYLVQFEQTLDLERKYLRLVKDPSSDFTLEYVTDTIGIDLRMLQIRMIAALSEGRLL